MKMKKENMDHIKARFESETGVKLPEKESFEMPAWTGRILAAAAGLICLVGLGLVWHKVSVDKHNTAETLLTDVDEGTEATVDETEETTDAEPAESNQDNSGNDPAADNDDLGAESEITSYTESPDDMSEDSFAGHNLTLISNIRETCGLVDSSIFDPDTRWTWPVDGADHLILSQASDINATDNTGYYISIPGTIGDDVIAMITCDVSKTGFDTERGNYVVTEYNGTSIIYSHLDTICVSEGDHLNICDKLGTLGNTGASTGPHLGITVTDALGNSLNIINVSEEDDGFYNEEIIED